MPQVMKAKIFYPNIVCNPQGAASLRLNNGRMIEFARKD
ncbi:hypothetical protein BN137_4060 [Cronobacter condimenti 1330]|uniref:Uncharacterized protein n=1 Tax=Cronobacter condimenti 1330 TaxID=1073999 RepID=K8A4K6_9ENTR|nr:hypothetical protein BN137_4060 [Cronobacter condimenti 1330]